MKRAAVVLAAALTAATPAFAGFPYNGMPPTPADAQAAASAKAAVGATCRFFKNDVGPQLKGWSNLAGVRQMLIADDDFIFIRAHGTQRFAFLAHDPSGGRCVILDAQPLPARQAREMFLDCQIDDPDPFKNEPLSHGVGLRQNGRRPLVAYLEMTGGKLVPRDGTDKRLKCSEFETAD